MVRVSALHSIHCFDTDGWVAGRPYGTQNPIPLISRGFYSRTGGGAEAEWAGSHGKQLLNVSSSSSSSSSNMIQLVQHTLQLENTAGSFWQQGTIVLAFITESVSTCGTIIHSV